VSVPQIIAAGGALLAADGGGLLERYVLEACGKAKPRVCFVPTASGDDLANVIRFYETYARLGVAADVLRLFRRTPANLSDFVAGFDVVHVGGGNTRSMLGVWQHYGLDRILRDAWQAGTVLFGSSAGSICWFEHGVTDSFAGPLTVMPCLGFLAGSNCPHYDGEPERRPSYQRFMTQGEIEPGYACDDAAALHYLGTELSRAVAARPAARAYRVDVTDGRARESELEMIRLT
jgi:dipeptidase E